MIYDGLASDPSHPVEGGSANDYDYVSGDPVNNFDIAGLFCVTGKNKNGSCRSIVRGSATKAGHAARAAINTVPTTGALVWARAHGGSCARASGLTYECTGMRGGYSRGGTTVGNVFLTGDTEVTPALRKHEQRHMSQWAVFGGGAGFPILYGMSEHMGATGPCGNIFERDAGFANGGYKCA